MVFTRRLFVLVALGVVPLLLSAFVPPLAYAGVLWNLLVGAFVVIDYLRCPNPSTSVAVTRTTEAALAVAANNNVTVRVRNTTNTSFAALVRDEPPATFLLAPDAERQQTVALRPFATETFRYATTPPARGDFKFGDVYVRITGPLGLVIRQGQVAAAQTVSVFPNLAAVGEYEMMLRRAQLTRQGLRRQRIMGGGREFSSLRDYTPDDEYRTIDWKATARRGKVISRTYEVERSQDVLLLMDEGRLMRQEVEHTQKLDHVINAALMLAHVVSEADDRIGLLTFAGETRAWLPPRRGRAQSSAILHALYAARALPVESDYRAAFRFLSGRWRKRSLAVLFTDLADPESSQVMLREIVQLARAHLVVCVVVRDPLLSERARQMPEQAVQVYEKAVAEETLADRRLALALLEKRGVLVVDAEPQDLSLDLISRYLMVKNRSMV